MRVNSVHPRFIDTPILDPVKGTPFEQAMLGLTPLGRLGKAAEVVGRGVAETLAYMAFPREHWTRIRTNNPLERLNREIRRRTRVVGAFPDGQSALMLVAARLRHIAGTKWGTRRYLDMDRLRDAEDADRPEAAAAV